MPARTTNLDSSGPRAAVLAVCAGGSCLDVLFSRRSLVSLFFLPLSGRRSIFTEILSQRPVKPKTIIQLSVLFNSKGKKSLIWLMPPYATL